MTPTPSTDATPVTSENPERKRLYWHSRRGMWELDLLLVPFLDSCYDRLDEGLQADYRRLLEEEDQDLFVWLMRREPVTDASLQPIVQRIIEHAENGSLDQFKGL
ncbi:succinate dehydrogenase assembly factor 2 [Marinospirillum alkaliphilum]|uniref:FAD assembly factor SdhE n=1 Tax=Marinospirillum alkaliphilum DSM 21637 TaxID=1122209 RepID=A0A1K1YJR5_9GAMM|nr:succinate dehydrogenase assembly factor 2 [Marinospirillum alkaliphilum]SFX62161.1 antitoxin CptB [Marinospirillum alkaliphilum DSM 21637]